MVHLVLGRIIKITPRHTLKAENEHAEIKNVEADKQIEPADLGIFFRIHPAGDFGKPVVQARQDGKARSAEHHVMKMADDKVGAVKVQVGRERPDDKAGQAADGKKENEGHGKQERGVEPDGALIKRRHPVEDFDAAGNGDQERDK